MPITLENLTYTYQSGSVNSHTALKEINLTINDGEFIGIIGHTGSGKSTLIQHLNGLIQPTSGKVFVDGIDMSDKKRRAEGRSKVGMVFQYPDYQLFAETVYEDIAFGPKNLGLDEEEIDRRVCEAMQLVGLNRTIFSKKSPFELSGGEKRRVAIAGIIAMYPKYLVLDEPMAGLDPSGRRAVLDMISSFRRRLGCAVIMVSHSMDDIARAADRVIVLKDGELFSVGTPSEVFYYSDTLRSMGLETPFATRICTELRQRGINISRDVCTIEALADEISRLAKGVSKC